MNFRVFSFVILSVAKNLANAAWEKRLLGETKVSFVATDAIIPRRPCAGSLSPLGMTQECCRRRGRWWPQVLGAARRQNCEIWNILLLARTQRIKQDYLTINDNKWQQMTINDNVSRPCSTFASETRRERPSRLEVLGQDLWCEATHHFLMRNRSRSAKFKQAWLALAKPRFCNVKGRKKRSLTYWYNFKRRKY